MSIIQVTGNVDFTITLDPGVWIFDDRRVDLNTYFNEEKIETNELEQYTKAISKQWQREIQEGSIHPPTLKTEKRFEKEKILTGTFAIPLKPFLTNAEPYKDAKNFIIETTSQSYTISLDDAYNAILGFSKDGKPLKEDGPVHFYYGDGRNKQEPIKNVVKFIIE